MNLQLMTFFFLSIDVTDRNDLVMLWEIRMTNKKHRLRACFFIIIISMNDTELGAVGHVGPGALPPTAPSLSPDAIWPLAKTHGRPFHRQETI